MRKKLRCRVEVSWLSNSLLREPSGRRQSISMKVIIELPGIKAISRNKTTANYWTYKQILNEAENWMYTFGKRYDHIKYDRAISVPHDTFEKLRKGQPLTTSQELPARVHKKINDFVEDRLECDWEDAREELRGMFIEEIQNAKVMERMRIYKALVREEGVEGEKECPIEGWEMVTLAQVVEALEPTEEDDAT